MRGDNMTQEELLKEAIDNILKSKKRKGQYSKFIVVLIIILNILFTLGVFYVFLRTGNEPAALVGCWFSFTTGELFFLSFIKREKIKDKKGE